MKIKWTNKWSGDTGFVKSINSKKKEFENTFNESEAKVFSKSVITRTIKQLDSYCDWNTYEAVTV